MTTLTAIITALPGWLLPLGWFAILIGWALGRPDIQRIVNKVTVIGIANTTTNAVNQNESSSAASSSSALANASSWATVIGLLFTVLPVIKEWLK